MGIKHTIRLEIRSIGSPDVEFDSWKPSTNEEIFFLIEIEIGETGVEGADLFQVVVATPEALRARSITGKYTIRDRSTIVVSNYDWKKIKNALEAIIRSCESESWETSTLNLQRYFVWEYETYKIEDG